MNLAAIKKTCFLLSLLSASAIAQAQTSPEKPSHPNIVLILADDLGYGDVGCYGSIGLKTPNIDRLAGQGLRFTDAHSTSATCTPARYSLLTGEYAWRKSGTGILPGNARLVIKPGRTTLPSVLQQAGYHTGIVGKWHLGLGDGDINWNGEIKPGPQEIGFDDEFIMAATGDRVPCVFVENHRVVGLDPNDPIRVSYQTNFSGEPTGKDNPELLKMHPSHGHDQSIVNGISRIGYMTGGKAALWKDEDLSDTFLGKAVGFIEANQSKPFFLYYAMHEPHVPRVPNLRFVGKSGLGTRGDAILQLDAAVGKIMETLERLKLTDNTLVIFSSDNGPVLDDGYKDQARELNGDHRPSGPMRGSKYSAYEAGTRVPFIVCWPARVKPGVSDALVSQMDLLASLAALTGQKFDSSTAPDTKDFLASFLGESPTARKDLAEQGGPVALRDGAWKFIPPIKGPRLSWETKTETGNAPVPQLFNLAEDLGETNNLAAADPERAAKMAEQLQAVRKPKAAGKRPNVLFIVADDLGWADVGANNPDCFYETPNLDRLARSSMKFVNGYAACSVCSPTRFSIMTGKYPVRDGCTDWFTGEREGHFKYAEYNDFMPLEELTLAEAFKAQGYKTAFVGKWHLGEDEKYWPEHQGFDINIGGWAAGSPKGGYFAPFDNPRLPPYPKGTHLPKALTDEAMKIIRQSTNEPWLLCLDYYDVHAPLQGREDLVKKYEAKRAKLLSDGKPEFGQEEQAWPVKAKRQVRIRQANATYAAMVEAMDEQIGRVFDKLDELGIADNTLVVFFSDNGGLSTAEALATSNLPLRGGKGWLYEGGIREPLFIRWPGVTKAGSVCEAPVTSTDFYPTFLDVAGLPLLPEQHEDGVSLLPLLKGETELNRDALFWHYPHYSNQGGFPGGAIRMGDWKLIERYEDGWVQLYNLKDDQGERNDLAAQQPDLVKTMRQRLHAWYRETGAKFLRPKGSGPQPWQPE